MSVSMSMSTRSPPSIFLFCFFFFVAVVGLFSPGEPSDQLCLSTLLSSLTRQQHHPVLSSSWTASSLSSPCNSSPPLLGATCTNNRLFKLSLPNLSLSGSLPSSLSPCSNLQSLDLSLNSLTGPLPADFHLLLNLAVLNLSLNFLSGPIPPQLALCSYLNVIDLHSNLLSGPIPDQLGFLVRLSFFDVSDNRLQGQVPMSLANRTAAGLPSFNATSFERNRGLYGYPLGERKGKGIGVVGIVWVGVGSGMLSLVVSFAVVCLWLRLTEGRRGAAVVGGEECKLPHLMPSS